MQVKLKAISRFNKRKDGTPYVNKFGKGFEIVKLKIDSTNGDMEVTGFDSNGFTSQWKEGDVVDISVEKGDVYNGTQQYNFKQITKLDLLEKRIEDVEKRLDVLEPGRKPSTVVYDLEPDFL